jgi:hypothetical protein
MSDNTRKSTKSKRSSVKSGDNVIAFPLPEQIKYDVEQLEAFIQTIFRNAKLDEKVLTWSVSPQSNPAFPVERHDLLRKLQRNTRPKAFYFGTSTTNPDPNDGKLYNRGALFRALHVIVLDDVGTKIPLEKLDGIEPTYIIESSQGNYQYGFVLAEPIEDFDKATAFIKAIYSSGYTDAGGAMPTKLVRLPCGINGKKGPKEGFHVELKELNEAKVWGCDELLTALNVPHTFDQICNDPDMFKRSRRVGTSAILYWNGSTIKAWCSTRQASGSL